jgi:predicted alpha/beta superfamily hydrolase
MCTAFLPAPWESMPNTEHLHGYFYRYPQFPSRYLRYPRDILIYLPPDYGLNQQRYPVLYMHDGNNLFDPDTAFLNQEWRVDEHLENLIHAKEIEPIIVIGIYNTPERNSEYTWLPRENINGCVEGGNGPLYARFLVEELKPMVDLLFLTRPERESTAVSGASLGGLISFYLGLYYSDVFSHIGMLSPSLWWQNALLLPESVQLSPKLKIWVDMGTKEGNEVQVRTFVAQLEQRGYIQNQNLFFILACCAEHNEMAWSERFGEMLRFFYGQSTLKSGTVQAFGTEFLPD